MSVEGLGDLSLSELWVGHRNRFEVRRAAMVQRVGILGSYTLQAVRGEQLTEGTFEEANFGTALAPWVLEAMGKVERERFVPEKMREVFEDMAYDKAALPLNGDSAKRLLVGGDLVVPGKVATMSEPVIVALTSHLLFAGNPQGKMVFEVGGGTGYAGAVLAEAGATVVSAEINQEVFRSGRKVIMDTGYDVRGLTLLYGNGFELIDYYGGFDTIVVNAALPPITSHEDEVKREGILEKLTSSIGDNGGRIVYPVCVGGKEDSQILMVRLVDRNGSFNDVPTFGVRFVVAVV